MSIEKSLLDWLTANTNLETWWLERPKGIDRGIVFQIISPSIVSGNLASPGLRRDVVSITVYHDDVETGKTEADALIKALHDLSGVFADFFVQLIEFKTGFDRKLNTEAGNPVYQFNRDFLITY